MTRKERGHACSLEDAVDEVTEACRYSFFRVLFEDLCLQANAYRYDLADDELPERVVQLSRRRTEKGIASTICGEEGNKLSDILNTRGRKSCRFIPSECCDAFREELKAR